MLSGRFCFLENILWSKGLNTEYLSGTTTCKVERREADAMPPTPWGDLMLMACQSHLVSASTTGSLTPQQGPDIRDKTLRYTVIKLSSNSYLFFWFVCFYGTRLNPGKMLKLWKPISLPFLVILIGMFLTCQR